jgi:hypothetical protein
MTKVLYIFLLLLVAAVLTPNPLLSLVGISFLLLLYRMFWTNKKPVIIFWSLLFQWSQINSQLLCADVLGVEHASLFEFSRLADEAYLHAMGCLLALSFGIWVICRKIPVVDLTPRLQQLDPQRCLRLFIKFYFGVSLLTALFYFSGIGQVVDALQKLQWGFLFLPFAACVYKSSQLKSLVLIMIVLFVSSFVGIFAEYKNILLYPLMFIFCVGTVKISTRQVVVACFFMFLFVNVTLVWTALKGDYRAYVAAGARGQVFRVRGVDALSYLADKVPDALNLATYQRAALDFSKRLSSIEYLSGVMENVPRSVPHEGGIVLLKAATHIITPRILFPNKPIISETEHLNRFIGRYMADSSTTSLSLGYFGDFYIDFGYAAPVSIFILGLLIGLIYRKLFTIDPDHLMGIVIVSPLFSSLYLNEMSLINMFGQVMMYLLVVVFFRKYIIRFIKQNAFLTVQAGGRTKEKNLRRAYLMPGRIGKGFRI